MDRKNSVSKDAVGECLKLFGELGIAPFPHQVVASEAIFNGCNVVISAPTGSGKTEAVVIPVLAKMLEERVEPVALLYITPLRALINDLTRRLKRIFEPHNFIVARKHGDISAKERKERLKRVPHVLITTPESLEIDLDMSPTIRSYLKNVRWVVIDELHEIATTKRGLQLAVLLERLRRISGDFQVISLSATIPDPLGMLKPFLGSSKRKVKAVVGGRKEYSIKVIRDQDLKTALRKVISQYKGERIIIFVNSRSLAERIHSYLSDLSRVAVHHSSISGRSKEEIEHKLKEGEIDVVVATKTLELGVDVGNVDRIIHVGPPTSVTSLLQRAGRAGHAVGKVSEAIIVTDNDLDYILSLAVKSLAERGTLEPPPKLPCFLDVVAREAIGCALSKEGISVNEFRSIINSIPPCADIDVEEVVKLLEDKGIIRIANGRLSIGGYFYKLWSKEGAGGDIRKFFSLIPNNDEKFIVKVGDKEIGSLDTAYVMKYLRPWDRIKIGGKVWDIVSIDVIHRVVNVRPAKGEGEIPSWRGALLSYSNLITEHLFTCLCDCNACQACNDHSFNNARTANNVDPRMFCINENQLLLEKYEDMIILHGPQGHKFFELLGYVLSYIALSGGMGTVKLRVSPVGIAVEAFEEILKTMKSLSLEPSTIIEEAVKISPQFQMKLRELLPTFATLKHPLVVREAIRQVLWEFDDGVDNVEKVKMFLRGEILVKLTYLSGLSSIAKFVLNAPLLRPWYGGSWHVIAEALRGMALTVAEISEITGLPEKYVERKLKAMRRFRGNLRVVRFYDTFDGQQRWALADELPELASDLFKDCFSVTSKAPYVITVYTDRYDSGKSILVRLNDNSINRLVDEVDSSEIFKLKVSTVYGDRSLVYYNVPKKLLPLLIRNAVTYLEGVGGCE